jgi:hypothetical protein
MGNILFIIFLTALIIALMYLRANGQNWPNSDLIIEAIHSCLSDNRDK